jgi:signal transduction histidine kinase
LAAEDETVALRRLLDVGRALVSDLDTDAILVRVLAAARELTGARYAALGVLDERRSELSRFITSGLDETARRTIGEPPTGRGVLGVLIDDPRPLRLRHVSDHPRSYGFPENHPLMQSFLGVPILIRGQAWGNLYLTDKADATTFTAGDEEVVVVLAGWAAAAIENAQLYERSERRRGQLERAVQGLEATRDIAVAIGAVTGLERVLELIVKRGRALIDARAVLIMLRRGAELEVAATAGYIDGGLGHRLPIAGSTSGHVLESGRPERIADVGARLRIAPSELGVPGAHTALIVPMLHRSAAVGVLAAFDRGETGAPFTEADEQLLQTFAASAANAVAIARSVEADRLRASMAAADAERGRWARELHDETLQILGGLRVLLSGAVRRGDSARYEGAMREAIAGIENGIEGLRAIIADLRPAALDELGLEPALATLLDRRRRDGIAIDAEVRLPDPRAGEHRLDPELETTIYRFVQEALTNVVKHARASEVRVSVIAHDDQVDAEVQDNGVGFDTEARTEGFGLAGMRERIYLAGGTVEVRSDESGTVVRTELGGRYGEASPSSAQAAP